MKPSGDVAWHGMGDAGMDGEHSDILIREDEITKSESCEPIAARKNSLAGAPDKQIFFFCYAHDCVLSRSQSGMCVSYEFNFGAHARCDGFGSLLIRLHQAMPLDLSACRRRTGKGYEIGRSRYFEYAGNAPKLIHDSDVGSTHAQAVRPSRSHPAPIPFGSSNIVVNHAQCAPHLRIRIYLRRVFPSTHEEDLSSIKRGF
ncbi:hypothetical protein ALC62_11637 [Cyphomyrmex costatus]|uniref:Uncharacterized protein n=1 Tax=Cyphomyrmex costatus TaxID=456900 RepID=A0A151IC70_9HYME|nr:hypothetical protein ALC62_11637 [Cyphomyrmex costatus]